MTDGYKVSKIYVGADQVRPSKQYIINISTDIKNYSSVSQLQALGWTNVNTYNSVSYSFSSTYGLYISSGHNAVVSLNKYLDTALTTSNKLTVHATGYLEGSTGGVFIGFMNSAGDANLTGGILDSYGTGTGIGINGSSTSGGRCAGNFDITVIINLSNGAISFTGTTTNKEINYTATMTSSQINTTLGYRYIVFQIVSYTGRSVQLHTAEIKLE